MKVEIIKPETPRTFEDVRPGEVFIGLHSGVAWLKCATGNRAVKLSDGVVLDFTSSARVKGVSEAKVIVVAV